MILDSSPSCEDQPLLSLAIEGDLLDMRKLINKESVPQKPIELVDDSSLKSLQVRPPLRDYILDIWTRRHFIITHARSQSLQDGHGMYLGRLWIFLNPALQIVVYGLLFGLILRTSRGMDNFIGFLTLGVVFFGMLGKGLTQGNQLIQASRNLIGAFTFPRAVLVISATFKQAINSIAPAVAAVTGAILFQLDSPLHPTIVLVVPLFILIHVFNLGVIFFVSKITAFVPDFKGVIAIIQRGLFYFSGVFYDVSRFADLPILREIMLANPYYQFLNAVRSCVLTGEGPSGVQWLYLTFWSLLIAIVGFIFFWRSEEQYASVK